MNYSGNLLGHVLAVEYDDLETAQADGLTNNGYYRVFLDI